MIFDINYFYYLYLLLFIIIYYNIIIYILLYLFLLLFIFLIKNCKQNVCSFFYSFLQLVSFSKLSDTT